MQPIRLPANQPQRFYRGGARIARFRGTAAEDDHRPEDWVGSTTTFAGSDALGLSTLPGGRLLRDAVAADPDSFLGRDHLGALGPEPGVLVKLLDAGERLPVHLHPDGAFAREHLGARNGKNEAWLILEGGVLHLGFREDVDEATLRRWFETQDVDAMTAASNRLEVRRGDCVFVPAGTPHAIGEGVFMVEVQEPSDLGVMLEWRGFVEEASALLGLPPETAFRAVRRTALPTDELASWIRRGPDNRNVLPPEADPYFRAEWLRGEPAAELEPSFAILVVVDGVGRLETDGGGMPVARGDTVLLPYACGAGELTGDVEAIRCLPPRPRERA